MKNELEDKYKNYADKAIEHAFLSLDSTLYLAYRDINDLLSRHLYNKIKIDTIKMLDFGCGAGLSTQIISQLVHNNSQFNVQVTGVDINENNLKIARERLPNANFKCILPKDNLNNFGQFDLIICNFVLVDTPTNDMLDILSTLNSRLSANGIIIVTNPTARSYHLENNWYTFNAKFPENTPTRQSDNSNKFKFNEDQKIKIQVFSAKNTARNFIFYDYFHSGSAYRKAYSAAGLKLLETHKPIGKPEDNIEWQAEIEKPPYKLHVLSQ